jgi:hypothetical protein
MEPTNNLWKNQISNNLKEAIQKEIEFLLSDEIKNIRKENKRLEADNLFIRRQFKNAIERLKKYEEAEL